jgi:hypothetical protein
MTNARPSPTAALRRLVAASLLLWCAAAFAQTDEIQVYDASIADKGTFNLTLHNNYTVHGSTEPSFPGGLAPNHRLSGVSEWAYGLADWFEAGLYLPIYSAASGEAGFQGFKIRSLFVVPHADDRHFVYGVNLEFSYNGEHWDPQRSTQEIRPIIGWHWDRFDFIFNPILDNSYKGVGKLEFVPATRFAYKVSSKWAVAVEEYADYGPLEDFYPADEQTHQLFAVCDFSGDGFSLEGGIGFGLTSATDDLAVKVIFSKDLRLGRGRR